MLGYLAHKSLMVESDSYAPPRGNNPGVCRWTLRVVGLADQRTIDYGNEAWAVSESAGGVDKNQPGNVDLMKLQKASWGNLGYEP